jgi:hypothetical protein
MCSATGLVAGSRPLPFGRATSEGARPPGCDRSVCTGCGMLRQSHCAHLGRRLRPRLPGSSEAVNDRPLCEREGAAGGTRALGRRVRAGECASSRGEMTSSETVDPDGRRVVLDIAGVLGRFSRNPVACLLRATLAGNVDAQSRPAPSRRLLSGERDREPRRARRRIRANASSPMSSRSRMRTEMRNAIARVPGRRRMLVSELRSHQSSTVAGIQAGGSRKASAPHDPVRRGSRSGMRTSPAVDSERRVVDAGRVVERDSGRAGAVGVGFRNPRDAGVRDWRRK